MSCDTIDFITYALVEAPFPVRATMWMLAITYYAIATIGRDLLMSRIHANRRQEPSDE